MRHGGAARHKQVGVLGHNAVLLVQVEREIEAVAQLGEILQRAARKATLPRMGRPHARPEMVWVTTAWKMEAATSSGRAPSLSNGWTSVLAKTPQRLAMG